MQRNNIFKKKEKHMQTTTTIDTNTTKRNKKAHWRMRLKQKSNQFFYLWMRSVFNTDEIKAIEYRVSKREKCVLYVFLLCVHLFNLNTKRNGIEREREKENVRNSIGFKYLFELCDDTTHYTLHIIHHSRLEAAHNEERKIM